MKIGVAIWAGDSENSYLRDIHGFPMLKLVWKRATVEEIPHILIPWTAENDHLEAEVRLWAGSSHTIRTHTEERIAVRDLVAERHLDSCILIYGDDATIDKAEILLAAARMRNGFDPYASRRLRNGRPAVAGYLAKSWLSEKDDKHYIGIVGIGETDEWLEWKDYEGAKAFLPHKYPATANCRSMKGRGAAS